jgi:hypothetical protein
MNSNLSFSASIILPRLETKWNSGITRKKNVSGYVILPLFGIGGNYKIYLKLNNILTKIHPHVIFETKVI